MLTLFSPFPYSPSPIHTKLILKTNINAFRSVYDKLQKEELGYLNESWRKTYLFSYNLFMFCGFLYAMIIMVIRYMKEQEEFIPKAYGTVGNIFKFMHLIMFLEVLNPLFGYTKGSVMEAFIQVMGRNIWIFCLIDGEER